MEEVMVSSIEISDDTRYFIETLANIKDYISLLENKINELSKELERHEEKERLTELWARGEIGN